MIDCARTKGPCSVKPVPDPPPCPPPPPPPFPWIYVWSSLTFLGIMGLIFFITREDCLPYKRPPMSKHMWWNADPPDMKKLNYVEDFRRHSMYFADCEHFMDPIKFYRKKKGPAVSLATGWCVLRIDADDHVVWVKTMCGEQPIYYERCLLAPGAKAKTLSIFKSAPKEVRDRVTTLHTIRDLEIAYRKVKSSKHVTIIGGGLLGTELAWYLGRMNKVVERPDDEEPIQFVHVIKDKGLLAGILPEYLGEWAVEKIKCEGVTVMPKTQVYDAFPSEDGRLQLTLSNGSSMVTDYVLVAIGSEPREDLAVPSFLELDPVNGGFLVNTELEARTHLYIAGDAASFYSQWKDTRLRLTNFGSAEEQGLIAGANMTGYWTPCNMEPHFELKLGESLQVEAVGEVGACMPTIGIFKPCNEDVQPQIKSGSQGDGDRPCYKKSEEYKNRYKRGMLFYLRDETVVGMIFWNMPPVDDRYMAATELLRARPHYKEINVLAHLMGFEELKCDYLSEELLKEAGPCIQK
ncbi:unnamed protein product [Danaus chrysippus]|uniref:(African queen) hypothetical protein n=1 Tax=Danaus chrysippus TaxID=151541 RepID=A0A8J2QY23_9NEOP|nr:unnamed protein product [Danaus chrysippus]